MSNQTRRIILRCEPIAATTTSVSTNQIESESEIFMRARACERALYGEIIMQVPNGSNTRDQRGCRLAIENYPSTM